MSESISFDVHVVDADGDPVRGEEVTAFFSKHFLPGTSETELTDEDGHAEFTVEMGFGDWRVVEIYVRGEKCGSYSLEDGAGFTVQID